MPPGDADGSLNGNIVNVWQMPLEDVGLLGVDKGEGVKLLILPPGYPEPCPTATSRCSSDTLRRLRAVALEPQEPRRCRRREIDRLRQADQDLSAVRRRPIRRATVFTDVKDVLFDSTIRYDASFFATSNRIVQNEPWLERDRAMIDPLEVDRHREGQAVQARCDDASRRSTPASREARGLLGATI